MARQVLVNAYLLLNGVDLSNHIESVTVTWAKTDVEVTAMGDLGKQHLAGLEDNKFTVTFWQDFATSSVAATMDSVMAAGTAVPFKMGAGGTVFSATNPSYSGSCLAIDYQPVAGAVGAGQQSQTNFVVNGLLSRGIT